MKNYLNYLCGCLLMLAGCKGCDDNVKPTPPLKLCDTLKPVSAAFKIGFYADTGRGNEFLESDTVCGGPIVFTANDPSGQKYQWWIGDETVAREGKKVSVWFQNQAPGLLKVKLKVNRGGDTCYTPEKQVDSLVKYVRFISYRETMAIFEGDYSAHIVQSPLDTFTIYCYWTDQKVNEVDPVTGGSLWLEYYLPGCNKKHFIRIINQPFYAPGLEEVGGRYAAGREYSPEVGVGLLPDCSNGATTVKSPVVFLSPKNRRQINVKWKIRKAGDSQIIDFQFKGIKR